MFRRSATAVLERGTNVRTFETGRSDAGAPVLLLLHGMGHWTQAAWNRLAPEFSHTHRIVAFDLPGFGTSDKPDATYTLAYFTTALRAVIAAHDLREFALAGHSLGGLIAANYAAFHPDRVRALALIDPAGFSRTPSLIARIASAGLARRVPLALRAPRSLVRATLRNATYDPQTFGAEDLARAYELAHDPATARAFLGVYAGAWYEMFNMRALHERFARYSGPVGVFWGRQDRYIPSRSLSIARRVYPHALTLLLDRCGHCPHVEYPQQIAELMRELGV
jgi:pimeloyl-ACP methyl ester carboxylesterase